MNDVEALEEYVKNYTDLVNLPEYDAKIVFKAIENLLKERQEDKDRIKELEEENAIQRHQLNSAFDNGFIHKDLVREKIQELKNKCNMIYGLEKCVYKGTIEILQDLLNNKTSQKNVKKVYKSR